MDEIIRLLMSLGKTKEEAIEFVGKTDTPKGGVDDVASNIIKPITRDLVGDYPLLGSRITDPMSQVGKGDPFANVKTFDDLDAAVNKNTANTLEQSFADQEKAWAKTFKFLREGKFNLSPLQKQNLTYNLGVFQRTKNAIKNKPNLVDSNKAPVFDLKGNKIKNTDNIMGGEEIKFLEGGKKEFDNLFEADGKLNKAAVLRSVTESLQKKLDKNKPLKAGEGKFTKAEYLIQRLENTLKDPNADPYVKKTFPGFIKELKADPDLAKNENVFKELGGDLPDDQQIVVYGDDTLDFFTQKSGPGNIDILAKFMADNPFLSREEALNISKMEPTDRVTELTKLRFLSKKKTDNAEGGIINLAEGGRINFRGGGMDMGNASNQAQSAASSGHGSGGGGGNARENYRTKQYTKTKTKTTTSGGGGKPKTKTFIEKQIADIKALSTIPYNFSKAFFGNYKNPGALTNATLTKGMKNYLENKALKTGKPTGSITNTAYNMPTNTFGLNKFMDPMDIALSTTFGQGNFTTNKTGDINFTGGAYDMDGKFGVVGDFIDQGGLMGSANKLGESIYDKLNPTLAEGGIISLRKKR